MGGGRQRERERKKQTDRHTGEGGDGGRGRESGRKEEREGWRKGGSERVRDIYSETQRESDRYIEQGDIERERLIEREYNAFKVLPFFVILTIEFSFYHYFLLSVQT